MLKGLPRWVAACAVGSLGCIAYAIKRQDSGYICVRQAACPYIESIIWKLNRSKKEVLRQLAGRIRVSYGVSAKQLNEKANMTKV